MRTHAKWKSILALTLITAGVALWVVRDLPRESTNELSGVTDAFFGVKSAWFGDRPISELNQAIERLQAEYDHLPRGSHLNILRAIDRARAASNLKAEFLDNGGREPGQPDDVVHPDEAKMSEAFAASINSFYETP